MCVSDGIHVGIVGCNWGETTHSIASRAIGTRVHRTYQELLHTSVHTPHRLREAFCELSGTDQFPQLYVCRQHVPVEGQVSTAPPAIH